MKQRTIVVISQVYPPDPAAAGQHVADAATELARRGHRVIVFTSDRGYDDPSRVYPRTELREGVEVRRVPFSSFGKRSIGTRVAGGLLFTAQTVLRGLRLRRADAILTTTSPPVGTAAALALSYLLRAPLRYWAMDINPDQALAVGMVSPNSVGVRAAEAYNRHLLGRADRVVVLDRFMADTINAKVALGERLAVVPPWAHVEPDEPIPHARNPFRALHGLGDRVVIMHSGNHGPSNPLRTILAAAERVVDEPRLLFLFVGGGIGKREIEVSGLPNVMSLPYQPVDLLRYSLSAADVHVVTMGSDVIGVVHPCKVYGAMAVSRPILYVGPARSHVGDLLKRDDIGWHVDHENVDAAELLLREIAGLESSALQARGRRARALIDGAYSRSLMCGRLCDIVDGTSSRVARQLAEPTWQAT
jgi:colanic acid biosynthesis glycosyl transferase WcaI